MRCMQRRATAGEEAQMVLLSAKAFMKSLVPILHEPKRGSN